MKEIRWWIGWSRWVWAKEIRRKVWMKEICADARNVWGWRRWMCVKEKSVDVEMNLNEGDVSGKIYNECEDIYIESERGKLWLKIFIIFKFGPLD